MSRPSSLVPYAFEGHPIRISTDGQNAAWFVVADVCAALLESPLAWAAMTRNEEEHCLYSEEGPGAGGFTLALIHEAGLLRRLLNSDNPAAPRLRRWLTHWLLPLLQRSHQGSRAGIDAIGRQAAAAVSRPAEEILHLAGVPHSQALLAALEEMQTSRDPGDADVGHGGTLLTDQPSLRLRDLLRELLQPQTFSVGSVPGCVAWLTANQLAAGLHCTLRSTNHRLAAAGLQQRNEDDDWQLTEAGRGWAMALTLETRGERLQRILWDPAVVSLLHQSN